MQSLNAVSVGKWILAGWFGLVLILSSGGAAAQLPTSNTPNFGPNVRIFDPSVPAATIQAAVNAAFNSELLSSTAQFGNQRFVFLFKPGTYGTLFANLGFYTSIAGLDRKSVV